MCKFNYVYFYILIIYMCIRENKLKFDRMMADAEAAVQELTRLEKERDERVRFLALFSFQFFSILCQYTGRQSSLAAIRNTDHVCLSHDSCLLRRIRHGILFSIFLIYSVHVLHIFFILIFQHKKEAEELRRLDREKRLKDAQERTAKAKEEEKKLTLSVQKEERQRRVDKAMRAIKENFRRDWEEKTDTILEKARARITAYIENKDNKLAIEMKFEQLKRDFFQPPTPDNVEREQILSSVKNIVFLHLQAKLRADLIKLSDIMPKFDKGKKGYLTYSEFKEMIRSIGANINPAKISAIIRGVDVDGDKCIDLNELELSMKETEQMGVVGSAWR